MPTHAHPLSPPSAARSQAARKLRQLGAEQLRPRQAEFEAEQQVAER